MPIGSSKQKPQVPAAAVVARVRANTGPKAIECGCAADTFTALSMPAASLAELRRGGCRRRTAVTAAMAARTAGPARPHARTPRPRHRHHRRTRPAGAHARRKRSTREDDHPRSQRRAVEALRTARTPHPVVVVMAMPGDCGTGEEDCRHDENRASDDHHPRRSLVEPRMFCKRRQRRRRSNGWQLDRRFGCLGHLSIMPRCEPAIKHPAHCVEGDDAGRPRSTDPDGAGCPPFYQHKNQAKRRMTRAMSTTPATIATQAAT
jgi:hypothetical protein